MRRRLLTVLLAAYGLALAAPTMAQIGPSGGHGPPQDEQEAAKKKKRDQDFGSGPTNLPKVRNAGPCPFVRVLYDAARYVEFRDNVEASAQVGFTGEIENISSACAYTLTQPIHVSAQVLFALGKGPQAQGRSHTYTYWVAVTDRNHAVLDKQSFSLPVTFPPGQDRVQVTHTLGQIVIPRANSTVSGGNYEVLVGFQVTPQMAAFNRDGKRFRVNAGQAPQVSASAASTGP